MTDIKALATSFLDALDGRDGQALGALLSDDIVYDPGDGSAETPRLIGRGETRDALIARASALNEEHADRALMVSTEDNRIAIEATLKGRHTLALANFPEPADRSYSLPAVIVLSVEAARIDRISRYVDRAQFSVALA